MPEKKKTGQQKPFLLVAVDFSHCSRLALRTAKDLQDQRKGKIAVLHVIDHDFVEQCIHARLGKEDKIKKKLFLGAKSRLRDFAREEGLEGNHVEKVVCEGTPCIEINKKAVEVDAEMIIIGNQGKSGDMKNIFFGSTAERVLRFITRPVLCIPPEAHYRMR
ncbi:MAG TPA: universal stress protein [Desulfosporosinus sp.]|nr:universal stress protein [Desulfosporosinus sp.]